MTDFPPMHPGRKMNEAAEVTTRRPLNTISDITANRIYVRFLRTMMPLATAQRIFSWRDDCAAARIAC